jgi:ubiquinone/menaquinone biosynthesis C-methylase UbiE
MKRKDLKIPNTEKNGFIPTLNQMGFMTSTLDSFSEEFTTFSALPWEGTSKLSLEIGAAYGVATLKALQKGAHILANDIHEDHLTLLQERVPENLRKRLTLFPGQFPEGVELKNNSLKAILICRVLHFFNEEKLSQSLQKFVKALEPGGKIFVVTETPYLKNFLPFVPTFEKRKEEGLPLPGFVEDVMKIDPIRGQFLPKEMMVFDKDVLSHLFKSVGFHIEKCEEFARPEFPEDLRYDGRESVGLIAKKK